MYREFAVLLIWKLEPVTVGHEVEMQTRRSSVDAEEWIQKRSYGFLDWLECSLARSLHAAEIQGKNEMSECCSSLWIC
jgi:hypothetical protein